ncbi:MAG TPA: ABC transporter substrate-binding protein [Thermoanaerobaculia bacterium]|nr:ABC transporter substrate-binding protein [Thermoanaerobaculia bacterium]HQR68638.1 ABC transporter substrate-binding protein [Thermoanaerobaculia bacterium]
MTEPPIVLAHSPDSDDAFMFYGLRAGAVDTEGLSYRHELADIETLNRRALRGELAITAVSFHAYAYLADRYVLLPHGASFGDGYGPCVVARPDTVRTLAALAGRRVAIPGALTSAALALRLYAPAAETVVIPFDRVGEAVTRGEVDAGVVIHEGQLTWKDEGFHLVADLGVVWKEETGLPLPLGGNAVRKDLGAETIGRISRGLGRSIAYALAHRAEALTDAMRFARGLPREKADRFVGMYVNDWTLSYGDAGREAVRLLLERGWEAGVLPSRVTPEWVPET